MRFIVWLSHLLVFCSAPVYALESSNCLEKSAKLDGVKRSKFLEKCLDQVSSPENVKTIDRRRKSDLCVGNAKNLKLAGQAKSNYIAKCVNKNEAAAALKHDKASKTAKRRASKKVSSSKSVPSRSGGGK